MCLVDYQKILTLTDKSAHLTDGRVVRVSQELKLAVGDWVEIYADLVLGKADAKVAQMTALAQRKGKA